LFRLDLLGRALLFGAFLYDEATEARLAGRLYESKTPASLRIGARS
jgi:hypothetical protein